MSNKTPHPAPTRPASILIIDDHAIVRRGLAALLARAPDLRVCGEAAGYDEAMRLIPELQPDILLVDITLKDRSGLDLIRDARARGFPARALVLSMHDETIYAERALRAGALGYVMKENADDAIVDAIRAVLRGDIYINPQIAPQVLRSLAQPAADGGGPVNSLTEREREIFECIGRGLSTRDIAAQYELSERTVEVHRMHIKKKLNCETAAQLMREAVKWVEEKNET